ncbi:MAG: aminotransferase class I/II-fold pyridoxal phosphate-dependent enzyme [Acidimicrobiia bacterium]|nr:aminotransferase class I/II-fold pyridoxal phosphate-dependent enzyme [Acidimicrobiia bacterium]
MHGELEAELAAWKQTERAVLFPTGYAANLGVLAALGGPGTLICSDELNHAPLIDGARLARGEVAVYGHLDLDHLSSLLDARGDRLALVVTDAVFSMDGDMAPVEGLSEACARHGALLILDEAHSVLGPELPVAAGAGRTRAGGPDADVPDDLQLLRLGTLSKTLGSLGGFVAGAVALHGPARQQGAPVHLHDGSHSGRLCRCARSPRRAALRRGRRARRQARALVDRLVPGHPSPIVPVVCGDEARALDAAAALLDRGMLVPAIRPPTVPPGTSRLRVTVSAAHTDAQIGALVSALEDLFPTSSCFPTHPRWDRTAHPYRASDPSQRLRAPTRPRWDRTAHPYRASDPSWRVIVR